MEKKPKWYNRVFKSLTAKEAMELGLTHKENRYEDEGRTKGKSIWTDEKGRQYKVSGIWEDYSGNYKD